MSMDEPHHHGGALLLEWVRQRHYHQALDLAHNQSNSNSIASYSTKQGINVLMICATDDDCFVDDANVALLLLKLVRTILSLSPQLVSQPNKIGWNALHCWMCKLAQGSSSSDIVATIIVEMIHACPTALFGRTHKHAWTPLHYLCRRQGGNSKILQVILEMDPSLATAEGRRGRLDTPLHLLLRHNNKCHCCLSSSLECDTDNKDQTEQCINLLLHSIYQTRANIQSNPPSSNCFLLHAVCCYECPHDYVLTILQQYPEQARQVDSLGNLPLHYIVNGTFANESHNNKDCTKSCYLEQLRAQAYANLLVDELLQLHPEAALVPDNKGRLPLFVALNHDAFLYNRRVILKLAHANVMLRSGRNNDEGPFLESAKHATKSRMHLSVTYELLLKTPEIIQQALLIQ